jgi:hypothetical protein
VPAAAEEALAAYAGRIRHDVQRSQAGGREETWNDAVTGRTRSVTYDHGRLTFAYGTVPTSGTERVVWVDYRGRLWFSRPLHVPTRATVPNAAAESAQVNRDQVARGKASIVGRDVVEGKSALHLRSTLHPATPKLGGLHSVQLPPQPAIRVDTWVDPQTYLALRTEYTARGHSLVTDETWLPRTPANVAATKIVIPDGFKHQLQRVNVLTSQFTDSARCAA